MGRRRDTLQELRGDFVRVNRHALFPNKTPPERQQQGELDKQHKRQLSGQGWVNEIH